MEPKVEPKVERPKDKSEATIQPSSTPVEPKNNTVQKPTTVSDTAKTVQPKDKMPEKATPAVAEQFHIVVKGDTAYNIAKRYNLTVEQLKKLNSLTDINIKLGQKLRVK